MEAFAKRGARAIVADINEERAADLAGQVGHGSFAVGLDAGDIGTIERAIQDAAERAGRRCYGIEIDPIYVDTAIKRWERMTGREVRGVQRLVAFPRRPFRIPARS